MITYSQIMPYLIPELPGVVAGVLSNAIREAAREFCSETGVWWKDLTAIDVVADQQEYDMAELLPDNSEISFIRWIKLSDSVQDPSTFTLYESATLQFGDDYIPETAVTDGLEVSVSLVPELADNAMAGYILTRWYKAVIAWACVSLMSDQSKPYYNPARLPHWQAEKLKLEGAAKRSVVSGHVAQDYSAMGRDWLI